MSTKVELVGPLAAIFTSLVENSGIELGAMDTLQTGFAEMIAQYGVNPADVQVARITLNQGDVDDAASRGEVVTPVYRYDAAFPDPNPDHDGEHITLQEYLGRDWDAISHVRYAEAPSNRVDQFGRPTGSTTVTHDAAEAFAGLDAQPLSQSAKRALAKKQEEEREALAAQAREARGR